MGMVDGKVALVTGSGRGLGRATAVLFAKEGAKGVAVVDIVDDRGEETVRLIKDAGGEAIFVHADVSQSSDVQAMVQAAVDKWGRLDCAVNNAMHPLPRTNLADTEEDDWDRAMAVNLRGVFICMKYEIRQMLKQGSGAIVSIGSGNEHGTHPGVSNYLAAKSGLYALTRNAAVEYADKGLRINAVGPGTMMTPAMREMAEIKPGHFAAMTALSPMNRLAEPEEVAEAVVWLCADRASYVQGHTLVADGGAVLKK